MAPLIILAGPTASGKSDAATALAEKLGSEIISADSMQVYKYFDIGTAKPTLEVRNRIPHHLIDILEPDDELTGYEFKVRALKHIRELTGQEKIPILVGGTGLYLKILTQDYDCAIEVSPEVRKQVKEEIQLKGLKAMHEELSRVDPLSAEKINDTDPLRIERALSVYFQTGKPISEFHHEETPVDDEFEIFFFLFQKDRKELYAHIEHRIDTMMNQGLVEEVKSILNKGYDGTLKPFQGIGYAQVLKHLQGELTLDRAVYEIKRETRHYAKRQTTWFKKVPNAVPLPVETSDTGDSICRKILSLLPQGVVSLMMAFLILFFTAATPASAESKFDEALHLFKQGEYNKAANRFLAIRNAGAGSMDGKRALYLLGLIYQEKEWHEKSIRSLMQALNEYKEIEDYIRFELANIYLNSRHYQQSLRQVHSLLEHFPNTIIYPQAELLRAEVLKKLDQPTQAIELLEKAIQRISRDKDFESFKPHLPELILKLADLHQSKQNHKEAYVLYRKLYLEYPVHEVMEFAEPALERLSTETLVVPPPLTLRDHSRRIRALLSGVRYREAIKEINYLQLMNGSDPLPAKFHFYLARAERGLRDRAKANQALNKFIDSYPDHPRVSEARYYIARNLWNLGDNRKSIEILQRITRDQPASEWAINAHFLMGRIYEENRQLALAVKHYQILVNKFKRHEHAQSAAWRLGWILYRKGEYKKAAEQFKKNAHLFPNGLYDDNNLFWMAKAYEKTGMTEEARNAFSNLYADYPYTFYGLQAKVRLNDLQAGTPPPAKPSSKEPNSESSNDDDLKTPLNRGLTPQEKFHFVRAQEMVAMGFSQNAEFEISQIQRTIRKNLTGVLWVSEMYHQSKAHAGALRLLELYRSFKTKKKEKELSIKFWKYFYPLAYPKSIATYSKQYKVDPFLVHGVIRKESLYHSRSLSSAGARGLMQIMPETGKKLIRPVSLRHSFELDSLYDPDLNIKLGAQYLSNLIDRFGNNLTHVLIAYNAGPHILKKWVKRFEHLKDPDEFIESIPYPETRNYVKKVIRNYRIYQTLYSDAYPAQ